MQRNELNVPVRNGRGYTEFFIVMVILYLCAGLKFKGASHDVGAALLSAAHRFPFVTLHPLHQPWLAIDAARAAIFFLLLVFAGVAAPLRGGMDRRWFLSFVVGCGIVSMFFVPHAAGLEVPALERSFYINLMLSGVFALLFAAVWVKTQDRLPKMIAAMMIFPMIMATHALTSFFYVFSFFR